MDSTSYDNMNWWRNLVRGGGQRPLPHATSESTNVYVPPIPAQIDPSAQHQPTGGNAQPPTSKGRRVIDITSNDPKQRGRGYTGRPKGRPLGAKNKPKEPEDDQPKTPKKKGRPPGAKNKHPRGAHNDGHNSESPPPPQPPNHYFRIDNSSSNSSSNTNDPSPLPQPDPNHNFDLNDFSNANFGNSSNISLAPPQPQWANPGCGNGYFPAPMFPQEHSTSTLLTDANNSLPTQAESVTIDPFLLAGGVFTAPPPAPTQPQDNNWTGLSAEDETRDPDPIDGVLATAFMKCGTENPTLADESSDWNDF